MRQYAKPFLGLVLLTILIFQLDTTRIRSVIADISFTWFLIGFISATSANLVCALRWHKIIQIYGLSLSVLAALKVYFQGVAANTVLPGGIVGGDIWRTLHLVNKGAGKLAATRTVLLDRVAGFWTLCTISLVAAIYLALLKTDTDPGLTINLSSHWSALYATGLVVAFFAPFIARQMGFAQYTSAIFQTVGLSFFAQFLTIGAFICCLRAVGLDLGWVHIAATCAGIFLAAVIPASIGGFGSREVSAIFFLSLFGVVTETSFIGSFLFGLTATLQGLIFLVVNLTISRLSRKA